MSTSAAASLFAANTYSYTLTHPVRDCIAGLAAQGFRDFELMMYPGHLWPAHIDALARRELRDYLQGEGLTVGTLNMPNVDLNVAAATEEMRAMTLGVLRAVVELAGELGAGGVVIGTGKANPLLPMHQDEMVAHFHHALAELVPLAADQGTAIYVENMPFGFLPRVGEMLAAIEAFGDARVGVVCDVANAHFMKEDVCEALRACAARLKAVHLSDTTQSLFRHDAIGLGDVDFRPIPAVLREIGFSARPVLEIIDADPDTALKQSLQQLWASGWRQHA